MPGRPAKPETPRSCGRAGPISPRWGLQVRVNGADGFGVDAKRGGPVTEPIHRGPAIAGAWLRSCRALAYAAAARNSPALVVDAKRNCHRGFCAITTALRTIRGDTSAAWAGQDAQALMQTGTSAAVEARSGNLDG